MTPTPASMTRHDYRAQYGYGFTDVIAVFQDANDAARGMAGYAAEFGGQRSPWRTSQSLAEFAREHFGQGTLRRITDGPDGERRYVVLRPLTTTPQRTPAPVIRPIRSGKAPVYPSWAYHV